MTFNNYLKNKHYSKRSIKNYEEQLAQFTQWLTAEQLSITAIHYTDLLDFIKYKKATGASKNYQSRLIGSIRHYYNYLKKKEHHNGWIQQKEARKLDFLKLLRS